MISNEVGNVKYDDRLSNNRYGHILFSCVCRCVNVGFKEIIKVSCIVDITENSFSSKNHHETHPCFSKLLVPFFDCRLSNDFVAYRLDCRVVEDC